MLWRSAMTSPRQRRRGRRSPHWWRPNTSILQAERKSDVTASSSMASDNQRSSYQHARSPATSAQEPEIAFILDLHLPGARISVKAIHSDGRLAVSKRIEGVQGSGGVCRTVVLRDVLLNMVPSPSHRDVRLLSFCPTRVFSHTKVY